MKRIPATVITGFLGAGKTTLVRHLLARANGKRIALIINEFGDVGVDGSLLRRDPPGCAEDDIGARPALHDSAVDHDDFDGFTMPLIPVADPTHALARLRRKPAAERRVALVLANYPNRDERIGNGVGLDVPESTVDTLRALADAGYRVEGAPADGAALMKALRERDDGAMGESILLTDYMAFFHSLPEAVQSAVTARWGAAENDPRFVPGELHCGDFFIAALRFGNIAVAIRPPGDYNVDQAAGGRDPAVAPPHSHLAFHAWLRDQFRADAIVPTGEHGDLEWLWAKGADER